MKALMRIFIAALLLVSITQITQAQILAESTFDTDDEGWEVYEGTTHYPNAIHWSATGGNPNGHVYSGDPGSGSFYFKAPPKFLGDMSCAFNGTISRDLKISTGDDTHYTGISIYSGTLRILKSEHINVSDVNKWLRVEWTLNADGGWRFTLDNINFTPATNANFRQVLQNVTDINIAGETVVGWSEVTYLDNVRITCGASNEYQDDIKWSQPPVENDGGCINGWDEVSNFNSDGGCWDCPTQCHGDADYSGYVDQTDLDILVVAFNTAYGNPAYNPCADFDRDGDVDAADQMILMAAWQTYPPADCSPARAIVADDWICMDNRPIKDIHWWGSFKGWKNPNCVPPADGMPSAFHLGIWTDIPDPDPNNPNTFSHPGKLVWENICDCYVWSYAGCEADPRGEGDNDACFKFDQLLSQDKWFYQESNEPNGTVYWLSIAAIYDANTPEHPWGWTTRPHFYNDDAVRMRNTSVWPPIIDSVWESGEPIEYPSGTSWDMAFVLTANKKYEPRLGYWPSSSSGSSATPSPLLDFDNNLKIDLNDFVVFAGQWLTEGEVWPEYDFP